MPPLASSLPPPHRSPVPRLLRTTIRIGGGRRAFVVERPALALDPARLERLVADLWTVARRAVPGGALGYGVLDPASGALQRSVVTLIRDRAGRPLAFNALALIDLGHGGRARPRPASRPRDDRPGGALARPRPGRSTG